MRQHCHPRVERSLRVLGLSVLAFSLLAVTPAQSSDVPVTSSSLVPLWATTIGAENREWLLGFAVAPDGGLYFTGHFQGGTELTSGVALRSVGASDLYLVHLRPGGEFGWAWQLGGRGPEEGRSVALDSAGNVFLCGFFSGEASFSSHAPDGVGAARATGSPNLKSAGSSDAFVAKFSPDGELLWSRTMGGPSGDVAYDLATDSRGGVFVTGYFQELARFATDDNPFLLRGHGSSDGFVAYIEADGTFAWARQLGGSRADQGRSIAVGPKGQATVLGHFEETLKAIERDTPREVRGFGGTDLFLWRLDRAGATQWVRSLGGPGPDSGEDLAVDEQGNLYATGSFTGQTPFGETPLGETPLGETVLASSGAADAFIARFDSEGSPVWAHRFGGAGNDLGFGVEVGAGGAVYGVGFSQLASADATSSGEARAFVLKLGSDGERLSETILQSDETIQALRTGRDRRGHLYVSGLFEGQVNLAGERADGASTASDHKSDDVKSIGIKSRGKFDAFVAEFRDGGEVK